MNRVANFVKSSLLVTALVLLGIGLFPSSADAGVGILCDIVVDNCKVTNDSGTITLRFIGFILE